MAKAEISIEVNLEFKEKLPSSNREARLMLYRMALDKLNEWWKDGERVPNGTEVSFCTTARAEGLVPDDPDDEGDCGEQE